MGPGTPQDGDTTSLSQKKTDVNAALATTFVSALFAGVGIGLGAEGSQKRTDNGPLYDKVEAATPELSVVFRGTGLTF